ncbi:MAG: 50S ribosomal protein L10 [Bacteroidetes bacterium]|jgi:large subunit ribosomal protein L10|nr:50S ribosomal protein L10 [Bacteroidota bacterium]MDF1863917.1 50S ribosomal protein L10 [Saprospiraceae bacterium]
MTKAEKTAVIEELREKIADSPFFYVTDSSTLTVEQVTDLRRLLYQEGIEMKVVKNTLTRKALEAIGDQYEPLFDALKGPTALMFTDVANKPAKIIKDFRKTHERPLVKAAYIDSAIYIGDEELDSLAKIKSKEEVLGELIGLLQSPIKTVVGQLKSGGNTVMGLLKAMEERGE